MGDIAIKFENISKQYRLGTIGTGTISKDLNRWWARVRGNEDPYLKIGSVNDPGIRADNEFVWALKDINLEVKEGEVLGIIGKNGAGKSTLLKILSRVTTPTTGKIMARGRIASLLEVGTGFHPEMTGRENIFMNGSIMGMTKAEITRKLDEIVDFSGVETYIDTPVKRYSSGMTVRLGFAIAAHLEPEILVVDEVLAVGDAEFQKKAIGKMQNVSKGHGRTVLFVSHNMASIKNLCTKGLLLENGFVKSSGNITDVLGHYLNTKTTIYSTFSINNKSQHQDNGYPTKITIEDSNSIIKNGFAIDENWQIRIYYNSILETKSVIFSIGIKSPNHDYLRTVWSSPINITKGHYEILVKHDHIMLAPGSYNIILGISSHQQPFFYQEDIAVVLIEDLIKENLDPTIIRTTDVGIFLNPLNFSITKIN